MKKLIAILLVALMTLTVAACKHTKRIEEAAATPVPVTEAPTPEPKTVVGTWIADDVVGDSEDATQMKISVTVGEVSMTFNSDGTYLLEINALGKKVNSLNGTYSIDGDKITMDGNTANVKTFSVSGDTLKLYDSEITMILKKK